MRISGFCVRQCLRGAAAPHCARVTMGGSEVMASAGGGATTPSMNAAARDTIEGLGAVPGPAAVPLVLTNWARRLETVTPPGIASETRTQCVPLVQYRTDVRRRGWYSGDRTLGCASKSSSTSTERDAVTTGRTRPGPA